MKTFFLTATMLFLGSLFATLCAQNISGQVTDSKQSPIDGATVILQTSDSTFVDAAITDSTGTFILNEQPKRYRLIFQHILYQTSQKEGSGADAGITVLQEQNYALNEVTIKGERPIVKVEGSRLAYDMPQLIAGRLVTNAYEAVKQLPGVIEQDGTLTLIGAGSANLILNGRPSSMTYEQIITLLKGMPASRVERAEVMYSTPPQYHVRGAAINIVLKGYKADESGLQGEINGSFIQNEQAGGEGGVTLTYTSPKVDADLMYNYHNTYSRQDIDFTSRHTVKEKVYDINQLSNGKERKQAHLLRAGTTYKPNTENQISLSYTASLTPDKENRMQSAGTLSQSDNLETGDTQMHNLALSYTGGFGMKAGADYTYFEDNGIQHYTDHNTEGQQTAFESDTRQRINRWNVYADQSHALPHAWTLNYGTAFTYVNNRNRQYYNLPDMKEQNTDSRIDEYTYNLYAGFEKALSAQWQLSASAAVEYYQMMDYKKWAFYPNLNLSYMLSSSHIFQLDFSSNKVYPDYWTLSGSIGHINGYQESVGNASLKPYTAYSSNLTYILKSKYIFQLTYNYVPDYFMQMIYLDSQRLKAIYDYQNWNYMQTFIAAAIIPFKVGSWWDSQLTLYAQYKHDKADPYHDAPFNNRQWTGAGQWTNTFTLSRKPDIKMEISAFGQTEAIQGSYQIQPILYADVALRYSFAQGKAMLQLKGSDLFNSMNPKTKVRNGTQYIDMDTRSYARAITLSFSYRFGGYKKKEIKEVDTSRFRQ